MTLDNKFHPIEEPLIFTEEEIIRMRWELVSKSSRYCMFRLGTEEYLCRKEKRDNQICYVVELSRRNDEPIGGKKNEKN